VGGTKWLENWESMFVDFERRLNSSQVVYCIYRKRVLRTQTCCVSIRIGFRQILAGTGALGGDI